MRIMSKRSFVALAAVSLAAVAPAAARQAPPTLQQARQVAQRLLRAEHAPVYVYRCQTKPSLGCWAQVPLRFQHIRDPISYARVLVYRQYGQICARWALERHTARCWRRATGKKWTRAEGLGS